MSNIPADLRYTKDHEWVRISGREAVIGITDHAQNELTDIIFIEFPEKGKKVKKGDVLGAVESVKSVSEIFSPLGGEVHEVNGDLEKSPELVNKDPYGKGWIMKLVMENPAEANELMNDSDYRRQLGE